MPWTNKAAEVQHIHDRFSLVNYQGMGPVSNIVSIFGGGDKVQVRGWVRVATIHGQAPTSEGIALGGRGGIRASYPAASTTPRTAPT